MRAERETSEAVGVDSARELVWMQIQTKRLRMQKAHRNLGPDRRQCTDVSWVLNAHCLSWLSIDPDCIIQLQALVASIVALSKESGACQQQTLPATQF